MQEVNFRTLFFRYYDRKIGDGSVTFSQTGISKNDFTKLCMEKDFVLDEEILKIACVAMKLTEEETLELIRLAEKERK
jgi:hypothetical protein